MISEQECSSEKIQLSFHKKVPEQGCEAKAFGYIGPPLNKFYVLSMCESHNTCG